VSYVVQVSTQYCWIVQCVFTNILKPKFFPVCFFAFTLFIFMNCDCYCGCDPILCLLFCRDEREIIERYFWDGFSYRTILQFLAEYHDIHFSYITLRRRLQQYGLSRRLQPAPLVNVWHLIQQELQGPGIHKILSLCICCCTYFMLYHSHVYYYDSPILCASSILCLCVVFL